MKKHFVYTALALAGLTLAACSNQQKDTATKETHQTVWEAIQAEGTLVVATPTTYQPTSYYNDKNELVGYEVDMMKAIGEKLKIKVKFVETGFEQAFTSVDSGRVDVSLNNLDITEERKEKYNISVPYMYSIGGAIVRKDGSSGIEKADLSDWTGKKAAGGVGTNFMKVAEKQGAELVTYDNVDASIYIQDIINGRTDFIPNSYAAQKLYVDYLTSEDPNINIKMADIMYNPTEQGIIMSKKDDSLKKQIDKAINELKKDGTLSKLSEQYYNGLDVSQEFQSDKEIPVIDISDIK